MAGPARASPGRPLEPGAIEDVHSNPVQDPGDLQAPTRWPSVEAGGSWGLQGPQAWCLG